MAELCRAELDALARLGHDLGVEASDAQERTQRQVEQIGAETLARLVAAMGQKPIADLFARNFFRGWRFAQTGTRQWEERDTALPHA